MKIGIIGAGAMGSLYGAKLSTIEENEVILIDVSKEQIDAVNQNGLEMEEDGQTIQYSRLTGVTDAKDAGVCDLIIIFVKSTLTKIAVEGNRAAFGPYTTVVTLQNGLGNTEKIAEVLGGGNILAGTTAHGASQLAPGKIRHAGKGKTIIGELVKTDSEKPEQVRVLFEKAGLETELSENVEGLIWDKLLVNTGINALAGITGVCNGELLEHEELTAILEDAVREGECIAKAKGVSLNFSDAVAHTKEVCQATAANRCSMLQDLSNHRKTEIDTINGAIVREGARLGIAAPVNETLTRLVLFRQK
jgi:2-dehydropantoate 2-reductase